MLHMYYVLNISYGNISGYKRTGHEQDRRELVKYPEEIRSRVCARKLARKLYFDLRVGRGPCVNERETFRSNLRQQG